MRRRANKNSGWLKLLDLSIQPQQDAWQKVTHP
jgi:hypothetical protein